MTDVVQVSAIGGGAVVIAAILGYFGSRRTKVEIREIKTEVRETKEVADKVHTLVNSDRSAALRVIMLQAKLLAEMTKESGKPYELAEQVAYEAERAYREQVERQAIVDAKK